MINLLAISYHNIGPFKDKKMTIFFDKGKFLIQAPIGSGKSFLFFDGPVYALYKNTGRNVLNVDSKEGYIKLLFETNGQTYLIVRNLTKGPVKDACKSQLFDISSIGERSIEEILSDRETDDIEDIQNFLLGNNIQLNEVSFKNESDLTGNLNSIIVAREVFLGTVFLLQDSENIFELQAADRLNVMKNIFNLMGIDDAKEKIADKRREIQNNLKIKSDSSDFDKEIKVFLKNYLEGFDKAKEIIKNKKEQEDKNINELNQIILKNGEFIDEQEIIMDNVNAKDFDMSGFDRNLNTKINDYIKIEEDKQQELRTKLQGLKEQVSIKTNLLEKNNIEITQANNKLKDLDQKLLKNDPKILENKKEEKRSLMEKRELILEGVKVEIELDRDLELEVSQSKNIEEAKQLMDTVVRKGEELARDKKERELKVNNEVLRLKNLNDQFEKDTKFLNERIAEGKKSLLDTRKRLEELNNTINNESQFNCIKINASCPFIKEINKKTFEELEKQQKILKETNNKIMADIEKREIQVKTNQEKQNSMDEKDLKNIKKEIELVDLKIGKLRKILMEIDFKKIEETYQNWKKIGDEIGKIDIEIIKLEETQKEIEGFKNEKIKIETELENHSKEKIKIEAGLKELQEIANKQNEELKSLDTGNIEILKSKNREMEDALRDLDGLSERVKKNQLELKKLEEEEIMVKNLYQIFSKELLLRVLQDYLPILSEIINAYLAQVVDYNINIQIIEKGDNLEMDIKIFDEKGERDIKSLSGGQKVILKLVWMLAISSYICSPILFLDETINNLDVNTVGKVADMLSDFVKQGDLKLYTVTHSQQIQEMDIWDKIIKLENNGEGIILN